LLIRVQQSEQRRRDDVGHQHRQGDTGEDEASRNAVERRGLERLFGQRTKAGEKQDHDERRINPHVDQHDGEQRGLRIGRPLEVVHAERLHQMSNSGRLFAGCTPTFSYILRL